MAKLVFFCVTLLAVTLMVVAKNPLKCYKCETTICKTVDKMEAQACEAKDTHCYIIGTAKDESWLRGCTDNAKFCEGKSGDCTTCDDDGCNSGSFITGSVVMSLGVAAIAMMR